MMGFLKDKITDEQILNIALELQALQEYDMEGDSGMAVVMYCIQTLTNRQGIFTEEELNSELKSIITDHLLTTMVDEGLIDVEFNEGELKYVATKKGIDNLS